MTNTEDRLHAQGRPRDPGLDDRAIAAALEIYGHQGYAGFTFGKVSTKARVGKSSLYLRWPNKADLLSDAFASIDEAFAAGEAERQELPFAARIRESVAHRLAVYLGPQGLAAVRILVDHVALPTELAELWSRSAERSLVRAEQGMAEAVISGDLVPDAPTCLMARAVEGAAFVHVLATPTASKDDVRGRIRESSLEIVTHALGPWLTEHGSAGLPAV